MSIKTTPKQEDYKTNWTRIFETTYYYWRHWCKYILLDAGIKKSRFIKNEKGYTGSIAVDSKEAEKAKKVLSEYKKKNPDIVEMWW